MTYLSTWGKSTPEMNKRNINMRCCPTTVGFQFPNIMVAKLAIISPWLAHCQPMKIATITG